MKKQSFIPAKAKKMIIRGDTLGAMRLLGRAWSVSGRVVEGNRIGRTLGYPTANLDAHEAGILLPAEGVYAAMVLLKNKWHTGMVNVGIRPTLNLHQVTVEAHLFNFNENIYGETIRICFLKKIREEMRFSSLSELKEQLHTDQAEVNRVIATMRPDLQPRGQEVYVSSTD